MNLLVMLCPNYRQDPGDWRIYDQEAEYLLRYNRLDEAKRFMERCYDFAPNVGYKAMLLRGKLLMFLGRSDDGCALFGNQLPLYPDSPYLHNNIAICNLLQGDAKLARKHLEIAISKLWFEHPQAIPNLNLNHLNNWNGKTKFRGQLMW